MPIVRMSEAARQVLAANPHLAIHSVFTAAVNLRAGDRLITCTVDTISAPHGVEMTAVDLAQLRRLGRTAPAATLDWHTAQRSLVSGSGTVWISTSPHLAVFDSTIPVNGGDVACSQLPYLLEHLARVGPNTGLGDQWQSLTDSRRLVGVVRSLLGHTVDGAVRYWIGRGPGLTPSGDDVLLGMIAALWSTGAIDAAGLAPVRTQLAAIAPFRTTAVSVEYLHYVCCGMVIGALRDLLVALGQPDRPGVLGAIERLGRFGHTSGMDCLLGTVTALRHLCRVGQQAGDTGQGRCRPAGGA